MDKQLSSLPTATETTAQILGMPMDPSHLLQLIADASGGFRHAEVIVQQRLYNFLMAESILLLASAASISAQMTFGRQVFVYAVSSVGLMLAVAWSLLGSRQKKFIDLHAEIIRRLEGRFDDTLWRVSEPIYRLRAGEQVDGATMRKLSRFEKSLRSSNLVSWIPIAFIPIFAAVILQVALFGWS